MKRKGLLYPAILAVILSAILLSCSSVQLDSGLSQAAFNLTQNAVFEVVLLKPTEDSLVYDKELDWSLVPYSVRNDKYESIGTAFAISRTELITAFHVIHLGFESRIYDKYFIRNRAGDVFEVDQVVGGSNEKDFLIFTVKNKTFDSYFEFNRNFREGQQVFTIGNALGEGIITRPGVILGTVPENDSGRWNILRTSADGNPGNSGGPLITADGKVVALVTQRQDNIIRSLPASVILDSDRSRLDYRQIISYGHTILANSAIRIFETKVALPQPYEKVREQLTSEYQVDYIAAMSGLFDDAPEYLTGPNNMYILSSTITTVFPLIDLVDPDDDEWSLNNRISTRSYNLTDNGTLLYANIDEWVFYKINKPQTVSLERSYEPRYIMDTILQNMRMERTLANIRYRVLSFGAPEEISSYKDALGRNWITAQWLIEFCDYILMMYILPLPNGPAVITNMNLSEDQHIYEWDLRKVVDHVWAAYSGTFEEWNTFINTSYVPDFLKGLNYRWQESSKRISFTTGDVTVSFDSSIYDWTNSSELFLGPSYYLLDGKINFGIRRIVLHKDSRYKESLLIVKAIKPNPRMPNSAQESWNDVALERFPYNGTPAVSIRDNEGTMGAVLKPPSGRDELRYALYLSMENPQNDDNVRRRFNSFRNGITIRD
jgi:hypothetical protein